MKSIVILIVTALFLALFNNYSVRAEVDTCVECHKNPMFRVSYVRLYNYYTKWKGSVHEKADVTCVDCHGGDPTATVKEAAHNKTNSYSDPESPTYYKNVPETCGECHKSVVKHFKLSKHFQQLQEGEGPNCVTCHGSMATTIPNKDVTGVVCQHCHDDKTAPSDVIPQAEATLKWLNLVRRYLGWLEENPTTKDEVTAFEQSYHQLVRAWHRFDLAEIDNAANALLTAVEKAVDIDGYDSANKEIKRQ